jgi:hypothetical protein
MQEHCYRPCLGHSSPTPACPACSSCRGLLAGAAAAANRARPSPNRSTGTYAGSETSPALTVARALRAGGDTLCVGSRIPYVIIAGEGGLSDRALSPAAARAQHGRRSAVITTAISSFRRWPQ